MASLYSVELPCALAGRLVLQDALAHILVELFIGDMVSLVWKGFGGGIAAQRQHEDPKVAYLGEKKMQAYSKWSELPHPLAMDAELATLDIVAGHRELHISSIACVHQDCVLPWGTFSPLQH